MFCFGIMHIRMHHIWARYFLWWYGLHIPTLNLQSCVKRADVYSQDSSLYSLKTACYGCLYYVTVSRPRSICGNRKRCTL